MKRIVAAFLITVVGILASWFYLRPKEWTTSGSSNRQVIAGVIEIYNDVNRQEEGRLLWAPLRIGDTIFLGDKIKTSGLSSASLQILNSSSRLEIEENSTVKMEGAGKKLALNMMEGRVFLKQEEASENNKVELLSGGKKIAIQGSVAVSLNQDGTSLVDTFKTSAGNIFQELLPHYGQELMSTDNSILLQWKPSDGSEEVYVETGESPVLLKLLPEKKALKDGKFLIMMRPGINFWRLVAKNGAYEKRSSLMRITVKKPISSNPIYPAQGEIINLKDKIFEFKWALGNTGELVVLEVFRDADGKDLFEKAEVKNQTFYSSSKFYDQGDYFWRIKSQVPGTKDWIESKLVEFKILHGENLLSPLPITPTDGMIFYIEETQTSQVKFEWKIQETARSYELAIEGGGVSKKQQVAQDSTLVDLNKPGKYTWFVTSESSEGKTSSFPVKRNFEVKEYQKITWKNQSKFYYYLDSFPMVILEWAKDQHKSFMLKISIRSDLSESETFQVRGKDFPYRPSSDGFHYAKILSLDESGQVSGESSIYEFKIEKAPLPPVPEIGRGDKLLTTSRGELLTEVKNQKGNWSILSQIINSKGTIIDERKFTEPVIKFNGLLPGVYSLQTVFQDQYLRKSKTPSILEVVVPEKSMIAAPKIKGIKVR